MTVAAPSRRALVALAVCALLALAAAVLVAPGGATAATPRTSVEAVEQRLMCVTCGTPLNQSDAPQAERERRHIERLVAQGRTEDEIVDSMVDIYGEQVLIDPPSGTLRTLRWLLPAAAFLLGATLLVVLVRRWRRRRAEAEDAAASGPAPEDDDGLSDEDRARLNAELERFR
ncbi:cytochrome c-type biogenesis protein CcmH [Patulibacter brassicae]|jgi:cytochrome c-type biogenesis protein CcmH|uniref:Cytochrome c-type biogenesis protein n=1 Tax=Patulibacter brassicae TaxID=1705717 RepID=A0ABU4VMP2_9ACTN|nr:cytochrome c-type biogenesis protein CcmH [Patulibacter brassicae]MDX8153112.1 cytochrome c-type biogenesis protein CcmH [Patulibacter brassicae]